jgi:hypothetical protein
MATAPSVGKPLPNATTNLLLQQPLLQLLLPQRGLQLLPQQAVRGGGGLEELMLCKQKESLPFAFPAF